MVWPCRDRLLVIDLFQLFPFNHDDDDDGKVGPVPAPGRHSVGGGEGVCDADDGCRNVD